ncbi:hypothetical protein B0T25DRAFT_145753 [Lasiosphaeria hispida]|uniref:Phosphodiesterase n=1 Tax=Lasiosphaeria hispida TaxID=260671 RepID=A0AAJ0HLG1_9PEZI|nr:hypothetical protein B0T25DRAFT_145753 [Lasiosphaeria hispida]
MEYAMCNVIYVDRAVSQDRYIRGAVTTPPECAAIAWETARLADNVKLLLGVFGEVHLCGTGGACLSQWLDLQDTSMLDLKPTLILIDTPFEHIPENSRSRTPSPHSPPDEDSENHEEELYGLALLQRIVTESYLRSFSKLVVAVPVIDFPRSESPDRNDGSSDVREEIANQKLHPGSSKTRRGANRRMLKRCLDLGATDVMASPMNGKCITNLEVHAYRAHMQAAWDQKAMMEMRRGRKRSWVGISQEKPFAYLREAMVSGLMNGICRIDGEKEDVPANVRISVPAEKQAEVALAVGQWHFCAHNFSDDELISASATMFKHALSMPELEPWRIPTDQLHIFLVACRAAYNGFVPYHNFRHVVDVLQATFHFLICIGALPPYPAASGLAVAPSSKSPIASLLHPFEALTLLITAIGHDVGHPGVNNGFLVTLGAPLAQLYNDKSVLESFHCAAYSQILRRHWPAAFGHPKMRKLMISSILATDMSEHFDYMRKLVDLQDRLRVSNSTVGWDQAIIDKQKELACALLIKCADISNVARRHDTALQWMHTLSDEFSRQYAMEQELNIPTSLMMVPDKDLLAITNTQLGFMRIFAIPLFKGVADILPAMQYCVDELDLNLGLFEQCVADELEKKNSARRQLEQQDGNLSPKTLTFATSPEPPTKAHAVARQLSPPVVPPGAATSRREEVGCQRSELAQRPSEGPEMSTAYRETNGMTTTFDAVADFARSDPFNINNDKHQGPTKQRCSETTEGSSAPYSGDWASQATSATTGKMPLSPSTQGTSIISRDSLDRPSSVPVTTVTAPESTTTVPESAKSQPELKIDGKPLLDDEVVTVIHNHPINFMNGDTVLPTIEKGLEPETPSPGQGPNSRTLKKKGSRFRINPLPFIRRHLSSSPPTHAMNGAG